MDATAWRGVTGHFDVRQDDTSVVERETLASLLRLVNAGMRSRFFLEARFYREMNTHRGVSHRVSEREQRFARQ